MQSGHRPHFQLVLLLLLLCCCRYGADHDASSFLEDVLAENNAAKCIWKATQEMCPPHVLGDCMTGVINW